MSLVYSMCGISGIINLNGFPVSNLVSMTNIIRHRGPDDEGFVVFEELDGYPVLLGGKDTSSGSHDAGLPFSPSEDIASYHGNSPKLGFGHRRLAILDLSAAGHQPMSYANNRYWIIFNGEIYNFQELRAELSLLGHSFVSHTDTEVILAAWQQWGASCQHRFIGMWAFAIYDRDKRELFISRDRYGIKPLYYWFSPDGSFCFASEIKQFTTLAGWRAILNAQRAYDYLMFAMTDHTDETMFKQVYHLPPGHCFQCTVHQLQPDSSGRISATAWYQPTYKGYSGSFQEATVSFRRLFHDAVKMHTRADVAVGSALSGGLDSTAIVCEINALLREAGKAELQKTFSSIAADCKYSEKEWMDTVIEATRVEAHFVSPNGDDVSRLTEKLIWHMDEPYKSQSAFLGYHVFEAAKGQNVLVLLNGQGADEYLSCYGEFSLYRKTKLLEGFQFGKLWKELTGTVNNKIRQLLQLITYQNFNRFNTFRSEIHDRNNNASKLINLPEKKLKKGNPTYHFPFKNRSVFEIAQRQLQHSPLPKYLRWEDRNSMAHSVEARVPFLDHRLVEFATQLPVDYLDENGKMKKILVDSLYGLIPEKIRNRKDKKGFITPEERWVKEDFTEELKAMLVESIRLSKGIIRPEAMHYFDKIVNGRIKFDYLYWHLILFGYWMKVFNVQCEEVE